MRKIANLLLLSAMLISLCSCKLFFRKPSVEKVHDIRVISIDPDQTLLDLSLSIHNPNRYKLRLENLTVELLSRERVKIGSAALTKAVEIPKKKSNALNFRIALETRPTIRMINRSDQKVFVYLSGAGLGKVLGTKKSFEFEEPYEINVKEQLQKALGSFKADGQDIFKIKRSYVTKVGLTESQIRVDFIILNPYGLEFVLKGFPATISIGDKESGSGNIEAQLSFNDKSYSREGSMLFKISNWKAVVNAVKGVLNGEISYEVNGRVQIDAYGLDFERAYRYGDKISINISELLF